jgi:predicted MPP superfamily phosphohydrolase
MIIEAPDDRHPTRDTARRTTATTGASHTVATATSPAAIRRTRCLGPPRVMTGRERRWINPNNGWVRLLERYVDMIVSRAFCSHLSRVWQPYGWLLGKRFCMAETRLAPIAWPGELAPVRVLLLSDIHAGVFLQPETLLEIVRSLMDLRPDLVAIVGDIVTGHSEEVNRILDALAPLSEAPLGAWFCFGNHDYFGGDPEEIRRALLSVNIKTLKNESVKITHGDGSFVLGGIDDLMMGKPDWQSVTSEHGVPHLMLAHNPDHFYDAEARGVPLTLSGHTHGGQIRVPNGRPLIRQSRFCLDEGVYAFRSSRLVVTRGLGAIVIPWRWGAEPEAVLIEVVPGD